MNITLLAWFFVIYYIYGALASIIGGALRLERTKENYGPYEVIIGVIVLIIMVVVLLT